MDLLLLQNPFAVKEMLKCNVSTGDHVRTYYQQHGAYNWVFWQHLLSDEMNAFLRLGSEVCCTSSGMTGHILLLNICFFLLLCDGSERVQNGPVNGHKRIFFLLVGYFSTGISF